MDTNSLARYLTINAGVKRRTGYSPATLTGKFQTEGVRARIRRAKAKMVKNPVPPELNKVTGEAKKKLLANLNRFK
eukprot:14415593-Heterocapsa_arctica.AAC.1